MPTIKTVAISASCVLLSVFLSACSDSDKPRSTSSYGSTSSKASSAAMPPQCVAGSVKTGKKYNPIGNSIEVYRGPSATSEKIINRKATEIMKRTQYIHLDDTTTVYEECINGEWSYVRLLEPDYLRASHKGWILSKHLGKGGQPTSGDKYARKISSYALSPYTKQGYPKTFKTYGSRIAEIEAFRREAAEMAIDSGKCDFVTMSELSYDKSSPGSLKFWVDCRNKQRIYLTENQLSQGGTVRTQQEKSWTKESAMSACRQGIKDRALIPSELDIHDIIGTSFYKAPTTHNVVLTMDFDAKNAFGTEMKYTAKCHFAPGELGTIDIAVRR